MFSISGLNQSSIVDLEFTPPGEERTSNVVSGGGSPRGVQLPPFYFMPGRILEAAGGISLRYYMRCAAHK